MTGELQEMVDKTVPCAAITEKRPNRLGGCVGIFFQLFDWNRRFAKKKLFSRKSLLPGKQASKRFGGNEKMLKSKFNLMNEVTELKKHEMRSPSLVARLMGLESMPSNHRDKGKKKKTSSLSNINSSVQDNDLVDNKCDEFHVEEDKLRPQKMQRTTGVCDNRVGKKFGSEDLQIKNVLTRVRKHHQYSHQYQKLASPVRSPRLHRKSSRLIDAAARILEPGLQAKRNSKSAIGFSGQGSRSCENVGKSPVEIDVSPNSLEFHCGYNSLASCKTCGSLVDVQGSSLVVEETGNNIGHVPESSAFDRKERSVVWRNQQPSVSVTGKDRDSCDWVSDVKQMERKPLRRARYEMVPPGRNKPGFHNQVMQREHIPLETRSHTLQSKRCSSSASKAVHCKDKEFLAMARGSPSRNHLKGPARIENCDLSLQRKAHTRAEGCNKMGVTSPARKRRLSCVSGQGRGSSFVSSTSSRLDLDCHCACSNNPNGNNESAFVPLKHGFKSSSRCCRESKERKGIQRVSNSKPPFQKRLPLDALELLQQKLKDLASQEEDEPNTSAFLILQKLLSSLALEQPYAEAAYQTKGKTELWSSFGNPNSDYTSPGSVLDASFSNESCFSNSVDNISGQIRLPLEPDWDILEDSATSFKNSTSGYYQAITSVVSHVSNVLRCLSNTGLILTQRRFTNAREVIIHTELFFGTKENYLISSEFFDELMIYAARSDKLVNLPGLSGGFLVDAMVEYLERRYNYGNISWGLNQHISLPSSTKADGLIRGVLVEVTKWAALARIGIEELINIEMDKWLDLETQLFEIGSEIACQILWCLVGELATDLAGEKPCLLGAAP